MSEQLALGLDLKERGQERVLFHTEEDWKDRAERAMSRLQASGRDFTADDLTASAGMPDRTNAVGAVFSHWSRDGLIIPVGIRKGGARKEQHARRITVWRGVA